MTPKKAPGIRCAVARSMGTGSARALASVLVPLAAVLMATVVPADAQIPTHTPEGTVAPLPNGDFEQPAVPANGFTGFDDGAVLPGNWHVDGSIDLVGGKYWPAGHGHQSMDLNGFSSGGIWRDLRTSVGQVYTLRFLYSGNPDIAVCGPPAVKKFAAKAGDVASNFSYDTTGHTRADPGWVGGKLQFTATSVACSKLLGGGPWRGSGRRSWSR